MGTPAVKFPRCLPAFTAVSFCTLLLLSSSGWAAASALSDVVDDGAASSASQSSNTAPAQAVIPGPLRSFLRMAGISQKISREEVLPLLGHKVSSQGFEVGGRP